MSNKYLVLTDGPEYDTYQRLMANADGNNAIFVSTSSFIYALAPNYNWREMFRLFEDGSLYAIPAANYFSSGLPDSLLGANGEYYYDLLTKIYYVKGMGTWMPQGTFNETSSPKRLSQAMANHWNSHPSYVALDELIYGNTLLNINFLGRFDRKSLVYGLPDYPESRFVEIFDLATQDSIITYHTSWYQFRQAHGLNPPEEHNINDYTGINDARVGFSGSADDMLILDKSIGRLQPWTITVDNDFYNDGTFELDFKQGGRVIVVSHSVQDIEITLPDPYLVEDIPSIALVLHTLDMQNVAFGWNFEVPSIFNVNRVILDYQANVEAWAMLQIRGKLPDALFNPAKNMPMAHYFRNSFSIASLGLVEIIDNPIAITDSFTTTTLGTLQSTTLAKIVSDFDARTALATNQNNITLAIIQSFDRKYHLTLNFNSIRHIPGNHTSGSIDLMISGLPIGFALSNTVGVTVNSQTANSINLSVAWGNDNVAKLVLTDFIKYSGSFNTPSIAFSNIVNANSLNFVDFDFARVALPYVSNLSFARI